jgi:hypothetical protein
VIDCERRQRTLFGNYADTFGGEQMSHFYGTLQGNRGQATRCGSKASGVSTYAAGWRGAIHVETFIGDDGEDWFAVYLTPWQYSGGESRMLATGHLNAAGDFGSTDAVKLFEKEKAA